MADALAVILGDEIAGTLSRLRGGQLRFVYDDAYRSRRDSTPLSLSLPRQVASHSDGVVRPWLWGLLPDNKAVITRWARQFQTTASSPFSLLATPVGHDCAGAVRFVAAADADAFLARQGSVQWLDDDEVATRLRELREDATAWLGGRFSSQFSLAGAQAKTALLLEGDRWGVPTGAIPTSHILKHAVRGFDDHDMNEHLCLDAARRAGLLVARTRVARFADESAIVIERYDRRVLDGQLIRIHQEDLCQALGVPPSRKYEADGGPSPLEIVELMRTTMGPREARDAIWRFVDALAWNWLIGGTDAHAKNYSLLLNREQVRLAPLYDIASALPYEHPRRLKLAMKLAGHYGVYANRNPWPRVAGELRLDPDELAERVGALTARTPDAFADAAASEDVVALGRDLAPRLVDLVSEQASHCASLLDREHE
jgi:serine/threonine-protein kinase HipA